MTPRTVLAPGAPWPYHQPSKGRHKPRRCTDAQADDIRAQCAAGVPRKVIAKNYRICISTIECIMERKRAYAVQKLAQTLHN